MGVGLEVEEVGYWGWGLRVCSPAQLPVCPQLPYCRCAVGCEEPVDVPMLPHQGGLCPFLNRVSQKKPLPSSSCSQSACPSQQ